MNATAAASQARTNMVDCQIHTQGVIMPEVLAAFETMPRERFLPENMRNIAYADEDLAVAPGRFLLEPSVHARLVQAAAPQKTDVVLDIGGGTGYAAAIFSAMVTTVIAIEEKENLLNQATAIWNDLLACNIAGLHAPLRRGNPENAPFDIIFINGAVAEIPADLVAQLGPGGRLLTVLRRPGAPVGQAMLVKPSGDGGFSSYALFEAGCPYLPEFAPQPGFTF